MPTLETEDVAKSTLLHTLLAIAVSILAAVVVWVFGGVAFGIVDYLRGNADSTLQRVARELIVPAFAGYLAMAAVGRWLHRYRPVVVFGVFATTGGVLLGAYLALWWLAAADVDLATWEMALPVGSFVALIAASFYGYQEELR